VTSIGRAGESAEKECQQEKLYLHTSVLNQRK
jgi:hypothetical protein